MIGSFPTQALAFLAVFVYATHATQAIAFEWKPGFIRPFVVSRFVSDAYTIGYVTAKSIGFVRSLALTSWFSHCFSLKKNSVTSVTFDDRQ